VTAPDLLSALTPVLDALRGLGVRHYVGGSIASSAHGVPRASIDADVVAELLPVHVAPLVSALRDSYYVAEPRDGGRQPWLGRSTSFTSRRW